MDRKIRVLIVDDDPVLRRLVPNQLARSGFHTAAAPSGTQALAHLRETDYDVVLLDIRMPDISGLDALELIRRMDDPPEVIMLTADTSLSTGIEAMRRGAYDYLTKPSTLDEMEAVIRKADEKRRLVGQNASLRAHVGAPDFESDEEAGLVHASEKLRALIHLAEGAAQHDSTVIITGESGTGKGVLAAFIHERSARRRTPMLTVNCGALPENLFESEFFGYEKGAFTGASNLKRGLIEAADGSTLFLDEIGEMPMNAQVKLLHFLESGTFRRVGATRDRSTDVRIITATNRRLVEDVEANRFRADLFYRLNVIGLHVPPLRERPEDIATLADYFLKLFRARFSKPALNLTDEARAALAAYHWPGNVRELRNSLERAAALATTDTIDHTQMPLAADTTSLIAERAAAITTSFEIQNSSDQTSTAVTLDELERQHIMRVLAEQNGNRERAAALLGISARTLYRKIRDYEAK
ncbi:MAG: sigma-54-dependent Fis family transcriptional regulator [Pyrinomonadaceae bacterium]|nr:sigma-54-dependent Fis family transcriptional regulator [Pyrinomonadaceae bacterium]